MRDAVMRDGKLIALPIELSVSVWGANIKAFESVGLTEDDVPKTYMQLLEFIDKWERAYQDDYPR